jgi:hypothetical protein
MVGARGFEPAGTNCRVVIPNSVFEVLASLAG